MSNFNNLNWVRNIDTGNWEPNNDSLVKSDFNSLVQDLESVSFYQKCLNGSTYVGVQSQIIGSGSNVSINNVYELLSFYTASSYYYDSIGLTYCQPFTGILPDDAVSISSTSSLYNYLDKIVPDYNLTLKNLFTPKRLINDQESNVFYVDIASTTSFIDLSKSMVGLIIDGVKVIEGHRILVKDQYDLITIPTSTNPSSVFDGYYELISVSGTSSTYQVPSSDNGIYEYTSSYLVRTTDLDVYADLIRYSICVKLGDANRESQFKLQRLSNGLYPEYFNGNSMYFKSSHNFLLRNIVEYDNLYDLSLNDTLKHGSQTFSVSVGGSYSSTLTYSIPERTIVVGEFGVIINTQESITNIIDSKYKDSLNGICQTSRYYWICADSGTFLRVDKIDFSIKKINLTFTTATTNQASSNFVITNLQSVQFINDLRGVVVGEYNQIWETDDGGNTWSQIYFDIFNGYSYNKVLFPSTNTFYVAGNNGVFIEFDYNLGNWTPHKKRVAKYPNGLSDEYLLINNIVDMSYYIGGVISIVSDVNDIYIYDINNRFGTYSFIYMVDSTYMSNQFTNLTSISFNESLGSFVFSTFDGIYQIGTDVFSNSYLVGTNSNILAITMSQFLTQSGINVLFDYDSEIIYAGNSSLWMHSDFSTFSNVYDPTFFDRLKPRMLFLDYDIGSKLYWFDNYNQYRLPSRVEVPFGFLQGIGSTYSYIGFNPNTNTYYDGNTSTTYSYYETNWITYWKDRLKTFEYYSSLDDDHVIEPSFTFSCSIDIGKTFSYSSSGVTTNYIDITNLMPSAVPPMQLASTTQSSRFRSIPSVYITPPNNIYDLYFYDYLGVWCSLVDGVDVGDVINITSDIFEGNFVVNKIYATGSYNFIYFYTDFNQNVLNNIQNSNSVFTVRNLNKYPIGTDHQYFIDNFNNHYIGNSYICDEVSQTSFRFTGKYSQMSAYYNLQSTVDVLGATTSYSTEMKYPSAFLNFGYSPTYNLLSYLNFIDPLEYTFDKEFYAMPNYIGIPGPQLNPGDLANQIYVDITYETNKLIFGSNLKYIYDSYMMWTFVDVAFTFQNTYPGTYSFVSERLLILNKYYDSISDSYIMEFHDGIVSNNIGFTYYPNIYYVDIISRRKLQQISDDLQYVNNIQRPEWLISSSYTGGSPTGTYSNYESNINFKVPTDSYTKILVSDSNIVKNLTALVYTDYKNELSMQITKLNREYNYDVTSVSVNGGWYQFNFSDKHGLNNNDYVIVTLNATQSQYPYSILGYHNIEYVSDYSILLPIPSVGLFGGSSFSVSFIKEDYFLEYEPIDLFDIGIGDKNITQAVSISTENYIIDGFQYDIIGLDLSVYNYRLIDGLDLVTVNSNFPWILRAEISNAVIGLDSNNDLIWYEGIWWCGKWYGGSWISGSWISGDWYDGNWTSTKVTNNILSMGIDTQNNNNYSSIWYGGRWFDGNWSNGTWYNGSWYGGTWSNGTWYGGTWNDGTWNDGTFQSGIWVEGQWNGGLFNTNNGPSFWIDGNFYGGDFENGIWYNGTFDQVNDISRFGTRSTNSSNSLWKGGKFISGQFHSSLNLDGNGNPIVSNIHKYSIWQTGLFAGDYYGGIAYNIDFKNAIWHGGILQDIPVVSINATSSTITLSGEFKFNINDQFYIVDNQNTGSFSIYGSTNVPSLYRNLNAIYDPVSNETTINTDVYLGNISTLSGTVSNLRCVSYFDNSIWNSGIWFNGVFKNGTFNGGVWYQGYFSGTWG